MCVDRHGRLGSPALCVLLAPCTSTANRRDGGFTSMAVSLVPSSLLSTLPRMLELIAVLPAVDHVTVKAGLRRSAVDRPACGFPSRRLHSRYPRVLRDLPWQGRPPTIRNAARRSGVSIPHVAARPSPSVLAASRQRRRGGRPGSAICNAMSRLPSVVKRPRSWLNASPSRPVRTRCCAW